MATESAKAKKDGIMQTVYNIANSAFPIRYRSITKDLKESAEFVAPEVVVSKVIEKMFGKKAHGEGWLDLTFIHLFSILFIGGLGQPIGPTYHPRVADDYKQQFQSGAAGVPAVIVAAYLLETLKGKGILHWGLSLRRLLVTAVSKIITRPIVTTLLAQMDATNDLYTLYDESQVRFDLQAQQSNLFMGGEKARAKYSTAYAAPVKKTK